MKVLGLDISSVITGWAVIDNGCLAGYGAINVKEYKSENIITNKTLYMFGMEVNDLLYRFVPTHVAVENVYMGCNSKTALSLAMLSAVARVKSYEFTRQEIVTIYPASVNSFYKMKVKGLTSASRKSLIISNTNDFFSIDLKKKDHDIADAISIAYVAYHKLSRNLKLE